MPGYACFVCVVMRLRLDKKLFIIPFYVLRTYFYVVMPIMLCNVSLNTPIACSLVRFPRMTSSLAIVNKSLSCAFLKFSNSLMFLNIQIDLLILKTYYGQFTLTTKNHCISSLSAPYFTIDNVWQCRRSIGRELCGSVDILMWHKLLMSSMAENSFCCP